MNTKRIELAERRAALVANAAAQRKELSQVLLPWRRPLVLLDRGAEAIRYLRAHPTLLAGAVAFAAAFRPWRMVKWLPRGWLLWRFARIALGVRKILPGL